MGFAPFSNVRLESVVRGQCRVSLGGGSEPRYEIRRSDTSMRDDGLDEYILRGELVRQPLCEALEREFAGRVHRSHGQGPQTRAGANIYHPAATIGTEVG